MTKHRPFAHWQDAIRVRQQKRDLIPIQEHTTDDLPPLFQFSQNSLQDYADCARRFQLKYIEGQRWPAAESEPIEEHERFMEQGTEFHLLVERHLQGIPPDSLTPVEQPLADWWDAYLSFPPPDLPDRTRLPEVQLSMPIGNDHRLLARYDMLAIDPGQQMMIVDWKTTRKRPSRDTLAKRLQTRVYPYVLVNAGKHLFGGPIQPDQVTLVYWFAVDPTNPEIFHYTAPAHAENEAYLSGFVEEIVDRKEDTIWDLTTDEYQCKYCVFRSLCDRGVRAGSLDEAGIEATALDADFDFTLDLDEIDEIAF